MIWKPSATVAAVVRDGTRFLLVEEHTPEGLKLNNPAGHLEQGEGPLEAVVRETLEETARPFAPQAFLGCYLSRFRRPILHSVTDRLREENYGERHITKDSIEDVTYLRLAFVGTVGEEIAGRGYDREIVRTVWMTLDELRATRERHRSPLVLRCIEDAAAGRHWPLEAVYVDPSVYASRAGAAGRARAS